MKLSKTSALAALALAYLAQRHEPGVIQARQVADHLGIPLDSALKILQTLARHKLIDSQLGRGGGYRMSRPAGDITLLDIVETIDGPLDAAVPIFDMPTQAAPSVDLLQQVCRQANEHVRQQLTSTRISDLIRGTTGENSIPWRVAG